MKKKIIKKTQNFRQYTRSAKFLMIILALEIVLLSSLFARQFFKQQEVTFASSTNETFTTEKDPRTIPTFIHIPKTQTGLIIYQTTSEGEKEYSAYQMNKSNKDNDIILYAQNSLTGFGRLSELKNGDQIFIVTQDGILHEYIIERAFYSPNSPFTNSTNLKSHSLTLYTTFGFANKNSFTVVALPASDNK